MRINPIDAESDDTDSPADNEHDQDDNDAPETPPDEPRPPRVEDPPLPDSKGPFVVAEARQLTTRRA
jgi:hypothetical protein